MKKVTIIGLGGAGINFLNSLRKKELDNLDLKLLPIEDENIDKNLIEKEIIKDSKVFVVFGVGRNIEKYLLLSDILNQLNLTSSYIVLKPFSFEAKTKLQQFENIVEKFKDKSLKIIENDIIKSLGDNSSIKDGFENIDNEIFEFIKLELSKS